MALLVAPQLSLASSAISPLAAIGLGKWSQSLRTAYKGEKQFNKKIMAMPYSVEAIFRLVC